MLQPENSKNLRVVSLLPSATEIVDALGCREWLVGRSHECDFPADVVSLPICTAPRLDLSGTSADIDRKVKTALADSASVYEVLADELRRLSPDVIITQDQCDVCAVSLADVEAAVCEWTGKETLIVSLKPMTLDDVFKDVARVGAALGMPQRGNDVADRLRKKVVENTVPIGDAQGRPVSARARVACIEWTDPLMAAGNWVPELVVMAGGEDIFGEPGKHAPWMTWENLKTADPDVIIFMPCGFDLERSTKEASFLFKKHPDFKYLKAVRAGRVYATDGNAYFNRPGPRLVDSLFLLRSLMNDDASHHATNQIFAE